MAWPSYPFLDFLAAPLLFPRGSCPPRHFPSHWCGRCKRFLLSWSPWAFALRIVVTSASAVTAVAPVSHECCNIERSQSGHGLWLRSWEISISSRATEKADSDETLHLTLAPHSLVRGSSRLGEWEADGTPVLFSDYYILLWSVADRPAKEETSPMMQDRIPRAYVVEDRNWFSWKALVLTLMRKLACCRSSDSAVLGSCTQFVQSSTTVCTW